MFFPKTMLLLLFKLNFKLFGLTLIDERVVIRSQSDCGISDIGRKKYFLKAVLEKEIYKMAF